MNHHPRTAACQGCGRVQRWAAWPYSERHDAIGCLLCDVWLENACDDCWYCIGRPARPSDCNGALVPVEGWV